MLRITLIGSTRVGERFGTVLFVLSLLAGFCFGQDAKSQIVSSAPTFKTVFSFNGTNGASPEGPLVQGANGYLYGVNTFGGSNCSTQGGCGTVFELTPSGHLTTLYNFCSKSNCIDGEEPNNGMMLASNGNFYGYTTFGGISFFGFGQGTMFQLTPGGKLTTLYLFCSLTNCADGSGPEGTPVQGSDGRLYGVTGAGGAYSAGTVFAITTSGNLTTLYSFCPGRTSCTDGALPAGTLVQAANGDFYGTTARGGANGPFDGTIFKMTPNGKLTTLYSFCSQPDCADGQSPNTALVQDADGNFYGTTYNGGVVNCNGNGCGTIYKITPAGQFTSLYSFCKQSGCKDGWTPAVLTRGTDGNFYGTTLAGGDYDKGTIFELTPAGELTTLYSFCAKSGCPDGSEPGSGVWQAPSGSFYGAAAFGGAFDQGTIFSLSTGLDAFVETIPTQGRVGAKVSILGDGLTGTTSVTFNGTSAKFTVVSDTEIKTSVPTGATTGYVKVTTPKGTLKSNVVFRVTK